MMKDSGLSWLGSIPSNWDVLYPKQLFQVRKERARDDDVMLTASQHLGMVPQDEFMKAESYTPVVVEKGHDILKHVEPGDFVISMRSFQGGLEYSRVRGKMSSAYLALYPIDDRVEDEYFKWLFKSDGYISSLQSTSNLVRDGQALRFANFIQVFLPLPPADEQRAIAAYLDKACAEVDRAIEAAEATLADYLSYRKAIIFAAIAGRNLSASDVDSGIRWIGPIPEHWQQYRIGDLFAEINVKVSDIDYPPLSVTKLGVLPQISTVAKSDDHANRKRLLKGEFAINSRSDRRNSCGFAHEDGSVSLINIVLRPKQEIVEGYYEYLFDTLEFSEEFYTWGHGIVSDLWTTKWTDMKAIRVPVPPLKDQEMIAAQLDRECARIDTVVESKRNIIDELKAYRKSLVYEYVTGKREVPCQ